MLRRSVKEVSWFAKRVTNPSLAGLRKERR
jgi:hypothetical protein